MTAEQRLAEIDAAMLRFSASGDAAELVEEVANALTAAPPASPTLRAVGKPNMVMRSFRVPEKLWEAAKAAADEREENISDVLREALERYVRKGKR